MPLDNQKELFFWVDENDNVLGQVERYEANRNPDKIHRAVQIVLTNSKNEILLQKRSQQKDIEPGKWTCTASGHVTYPNTYEETAQRELQEELGIEAPLTYVTKSLMVGKSEREIDAIFTGIFEKTPKDFDRDEVDEVKWVTKTELQEMAESHLLTRMSLATFKILKYL